MKIEIKSRFTGSVLFSHEAEDNTIKLTLHAAVSIRAELYGANLGGANLGGANLRSANLGGADLRGADLRGANLSGANLYCADLYCADLYGANLRGANLGGADLYCADLRGADLYCANLRGANLRGKEKLIGKRPIFQIGPIGSRSAYFVAYITDKGLRLRAGCFFGSKEEFESKLDEEHGNNEHAVEYRAALALIDKHAELWTPAEDEQAATEEEKAA